MANTPGADNRITDDIKLTTWPVRLTPSVTQEVLPARPSGYQFR